MARFRAGTAFGVAALAVAVLAGCTAPTPKPQPSASTSTTASPSSTSTPVATLVPNGTAEQDKPFFDLVNTRLFASNGSAAGRDIIDNLVASGFVKAAMQVTPDKTSIGGNADSILFSVKIGESCLLGQHSGAGYESSVQKALANGTCLIGKTRSIDW